MRAVFPTFLVAVLVALVRLPRVVVEGTSMVPVLAPGERLVVVPLRARPGRLIVLRDPRAPERILVKRVTAVGPAGVEVRGDNAAASTDSRQFGPVDRTLVLGRPLYRYAPPAHAGWLWAT